jgi:hypothetical protein
VSFLDDLEALGQDVDELVRLWQVRRDLQPVGEPAEVLLVA